MSKIKTILLDFGGVVITLDARQAAHRFAVLGLTDADNKLDPYTQGGIFGALESGQISDTEFVDAFSRLAGKRVEPEQCLWAWVGYCGSVPQRNLDTISWLRDDGYRVALVSNTNPFMMKWALSGAFDGKGNGVDHYFDKLYLSYKIGAMKPDPKYFQAVIDGERLNPAEALFVDDGPRNVAAAKSFGFNVLCPGNGDDWASDIRNYLI